MESSPGMLISLFASWVVLLSAVLFLIFAIASSTFSATSKTVSLGVNYTFAVDSSNFALSG